MVDAEQIVQFTQRCRIQFATTATGPQVPWTILYFDFSGMFPESSFAGRKYPTLHRAICAFRSLFTRALKVSGLNVIISPNCTHLKPLGLGKVAGFFGTFDPISEGACWYGSITYALEGGSSHKISPDLFRWVDPVQIQQSDASFGAQSPVGNGREGSSKKSAWFILMKQNKT